MKRLHIHVAVENISDAVKFYSTMFGAEPVKLKSDYAKWLLDDPRVNFAISCRGRKIGVDHLGIQVEEDHELSEVRERLQSADVKTFAEGETTCCYSKADKTWTMDPAGIAWETYKNMEDAEIFGKDIDIKQESEESACCVPAMPKPKISLKDIVKNKKSCC